MEKRGQISGFIAFGIVLLCALAFSSLLFRSTSGNLLTGPAEAMRTTKAPLQSYVQACINLELTESMELFGTSPDAEPYYAVYINQELPRCADFKEFRDSGIEITRGEPNSEIRITGQHATAIVRYPLLAAIGTDELSLSSFTAIVPTERTRTLDLRPLGGSTETSVTAPDSRAELILPPGTGLADSEGAIVTELSFSQSDRFFNGLDNYEMLGNTVYELTPHRARISPYAQLVLEYDPSELPPGFEETDLKVAFFNEASGSWTAYPSVVDPAENKIYATITHFSYVSIQFGCGGADDEASDEFLFTSDYVYKEPLKGGDICRGWEADAGEFTKKDPGMSISLDNSYQWMEFVSEPGQTDSDGNGISDGWSYSSPEDVCGEGTIRFRIDTDDRAGCSGEESSTGIELSFFDISEGDSLSEVQLNGRTISYSNPMLLPQSDLKNVNTITVKMENTNNDGCCHVKANLKVTGAHGAILQDNTDFVPLVAAVADEAQTGTQQGQPGITVQQRINYLCRYGPVGEDSYNPRGSGGYPACNGQDIGFNDQDISAELTCLDKARGAGRVLFESGCIPSDGDVYNDYTKGYLSSDDAVVQGSVTNIISGHTPGSIKKPVAPKTGCCEISGILYGVTTEAQCQSFGLRHGMEQTQFFDCTICPQGKQLSGLHRGCVCSQSSQVYQPEYRYNHMQAGTEPELVPAYCTSQGFTEEFQDMILAERCPGGSWPLPQHTIASPIGCMDSSTYYFQGSIGTYCAMKCTGGKCIRDVGCVSTVGSGISAVYLPPTNPGEMEATYASYIPIKEEVGTGAYLLAQFGLSGDSSRLWLPIVELTNGLPVDTGVRVPLFTEAEIKNSKLSFVPVRITHASGTIDKYYAPVVSGRDSSQVLSPQSVESTTDPEPLPNVNIIHRMLMVREFAESAQLRADARVQQALLSVNRGKILALVSSLTSSDSTVTASDGSPSVMYLPLFAVQGSTEPIGYSLDTYSTDKLMARTGNENQEAQPAIVVVEERSDGTVWDTGQRIALCMEDAAGLPLFAYCAASSSVSSLVSGLMSKIPVILSAADKPINAYILAHKEDIEEMHIPEIALAVQPYAEQAPAVAGAVADVAIQIKDYTEEEIRGLRLDEGARAMMKMYKQGVIVGASLVQHKITGAPQHQCKPRIGTGPQFPGTPGGVAWADGTCYVCPLSVLNMETGAWTEGTGCQLCDGIAGDQEYYCKGNTFFYCDKGKAKYGQQCTACSEVSGKTVAPSWISWNCGICNADEDVTASAKQGAVHWDGDKCWQCGRRTSGSSSIFDWIDTTGTCICAEEKCCDSRRNLLGMAISSTFNFEYNLWPRSTYICDSNNREVPIVSYCSPERTISELDTTANCRCEHNNVYQSNPCEKQMCDEGTCCTVSDLEGTYRWPVGEFYCWGKPGNIKLYICGEGGSITTIQDDNCICNQGEIYDYNPCPGMCMPDINVPKNGEQGDSYWDGSDCWHCGAISGKPLAWFKATDACLCPEQGCCEYNLITNFNDLGNILNKDKWEKGKHLCRAFSATPLDLTRSILSYKLIECKSDGTTQETILEKYCTCTDHQTYPGNTPVSDFCPKG